MNSPAHFRRLHHKLLDIPQSERDDAWFTQMALVCEAKLNNASLYELQERVRTLMALMDPPTD